MVHQLKVKCCLIVCCTDYEESSAAAYLPAVVSTNGEDSKHVMMLYSLIAASTYVDLIDKVHWTTDSKRAVQWNMDDVVTRAQAVQIHLKYSNARVKRLKIGNT